MSQEEETSLEEVDAEMWEGEDEEDKQNKDDDMHHVNDKQNEEDNMSEILSETGLSIENEEDEKDMLDEEDGLDEESDGRSEEGGAQANRPAHEDGEPQDDEGTGLSAKEFFKKFERAVRNKVDNLFTTLKNYTKETIQGYDKHADSPGAISIVVSPQGSIDYRISANLNTNLVVKKYAHRLLWAVQISVQAKRHENSEEDLVDVGDKDSLPPEVAEDQAKKAQQRQVEYNRRLKHSASEVVAKVKIHINLVGKSGFCSYSFKHVCGAPGSDHNACKEHRKTWKWPENVPFVNPTYLTQDQCLTLIDHYGKQFPSCSGAPAQHPHPRYLTLFVV
jgi:hypothetical protein